MPKKKPPPEVCFGLDAHELNAWLDQRGTKGLVEYLNARHYTLLNELAVAVAKDQDAKLISGQLVELDQLLAKLNAVAEIPETARVYPEAEDEASDEDPYTDPALSRHGDQQWIGMQHKR